MSSTTIAATAERAPARRGLYRFAVFLAVYTLLHIKGGAMVVSTGSGMAFTDWPLADGSFWPPDMDLSKLFEHLHRYFGAILGVLGIVLAWWIVRDDRRPWLVKVGWGLVALIAVQGLIGGLGVTHYVDANGIKHTYPPAAIAHAVLGQVTLCVLVFMAFALSGAWADRVPADARAVGTTRRFAAFALGCVLVQLFIGAVFRHTNVQNALWLHVAMALVVSVAILIAAAHSSARFGQRVPGFRSLAKWVYILLLAQLTLGFVTLAIRRFKDPSNIEYLGRSVIVSSHVLVGATLFLTATLLVARAWRNLDPVEQAR